MAAQVTLSETRFDVVPGGAAVLIVTAFNTGVVVDEIRIEVLGPTAAWAVVEPPTLSLFPSTSGTVAITFRVPDGSGTPAGPVPFGVRATCREDPAGTAVEEGEIVVAAFAEAQILISPTITRGTKRADAEVVLENKGNSPVELHLTGRSDSAAVRVEPPDVLVPAGDITIARATVIPDRRFLRGPDRQFEYGVIATSDEHPELRATAQMVQSARLPKWVMPVLLILLLLAVIAPFAIWGARSQVKSMAREVSKDEIAKSNPSAIGSAGSGAGSGGGAGNGGGGAGGGSGIGGGSVAGGPGGGQVRPIDGRLFLTSTGQQSFPVPDGKTLRVTDIVLQNPASNTGMLRVRRDDQILIEVALENFRSQDFHFVTPLSFSGGQKLVIDATCVGPCTPSALFSATLVG